MLRPIVFILFFIGVLSSPFQRDVQPQLDEQIVSGEDGTIEQFPFLVSLRDHAGKHKCGGSLLKSNIVITASHCVIGDLPEDLVVVAGTSSQTLEGVRIGVKKIVTHPAYDAKTIQNDVALLLLENHFEFSEQIQPIGLIASHKEMRAGIKSLVSGWGLADDGSTFDILQWVTVTLVDKQKCRDAYKKVRMITEDMMCAGEKHRVRDACRNDSGGPLVAEKVLIGIVSWGEVCGSSDYPGVFASVAILRDWIDESVEILEKA